MCTVLAVDSESGMRTAEYQPEALRHCTSRARRANTGSVRLHCKTSVHQLEAGRAPTLETKCEQRKTAWLERCPLPLRHLRAFLCVEDRAICTSSHSPTNLSLPSS